jgi:predicted RNA-binding protein
MIADSQRVRKGDFIIFYLQQKYEEGIYEGKFYGIFKVKEAPSFLDNNDSRQYLRTGLEKSLTFRILLEPYQVYPKGVTEWEALDEIKNIPSTNQMIWSLIYRKLKGNRGNTMITIYESESLFKLILDKNSGITLPNNGFTFDSANQEIKSIAKAKEYTGRKESINILPRLIRKYEENKTFESHLQAYIVQNVGRGTNTSLDRSLVEDDWEIEWLGNEVSCGVGMQRIDVMLSLINGRRYRCVPIELKAVEAESTVIYQIKRYLDWIEQYYLPNRSSEIKPVLIAKKIGDKTTSAYDVLIQALKEFNAKNMQCLPLKYVEFIIEKDSIVFEYIDYS